MHTDCFDKCSTLWTRPTRQYWYFTWYNFPGKKWRSNIKTCDFSDNFQSICRIFELSSGQKHERSSLLVFNLDIISNFCIRFIESQSLPSNDSLLLFINGGPGCSSLFGQFEEIGPFRVAGDGQTLYENVFSWNKVVNVFVSRLIWNFQVSNLLAIDAPGTGFSWQVNSKQDDSFVTQSILNALCDFYTIFPQLTRNDLYVVGEGYGSFFASALVESLLINNTPRPDVLISPIKIRVWLTFAFAHAIFYLGAVTCQCWLERKASV